MKGMKIWGTLRVPDEITEREVIDQLVTMFSIYGPDWAFNGLISEEEKDVISTGNGEEGRDL